MAQTGQGGQSTPGTQSVPGQTPQTDTSAPPPPQHPEVVQEVLDRFPESWVPEWRFADGIPTVAVQPAQIVDAVRWLREECEPRFDCLVDVLGAHWPQRDNPFEVTYLLHSFATNTRVRLKVSVGGDPPTVPTLALYWPASNWQEREIYDLFGVIFEGHPDLRRIVTPTDWEGHPLRKDFPLGEEPVEFYLQPDNPPIAGPAGGRLHPPIA